MQILSEVNYNEIINHSRSLELHNANYVPIGLFHL